MIVPGRKSDVGWGEGNWIFLDLGFSNQGQTCGLAFEEGPPICMRFGRARTAVIEAILQRGGSINLLIEAPLSVCFDIHGNPKGRTVERRLDVSPRYWYVGAGCVVMTAATYLIRAIHEAINGKPRIEVRLFEGFVSFKQGATDHKQDVCALREQVKRAKLNRDSIYEPDQLKLENEDEIFSAFRVAGLDLGVPAVIVAEQSPRLAG